jgi:hypothetical protein
MIRTAHALKLREKLKKIWSNKLQSEKVLYPENTAHEPGLLALFEVMPNPLSQDQITEFYKNHAEQEYNKQLRHLASKGWDIRSGNTRYNQGLIDRSIQSNEMILFSVTEANPVWRGNITKRQGFLSSISWEDKLKLYINHGCAVCGQIYESYDKGHLDPTKEYSEDNIVPMCSKCNNWAQDRIIFKLNDLVARPQRVIARYWIERMDYYYSQEEQKLIRDALNKKFDG